MKEDSNNAVSVYHEDAMDNFPVLKAFQQYIDAEQTKARKRLIFLCVFFGLLMAGVISVFVSLLMAAGEKNEKLNEKLFEYAMQDRSRMPTVVSQPQNDAALKVITDTLGNLQKQLADQQAKSAELSEKMTKKPEGPTPDQVALQRRMDVESEELKKATALLLSERNKLAEQKEDLRRLEVELQRRRLYPEYYSRTDESTGNETESATPKPAAKQSVKSAVKSTKHPVAQPVTKKQALTLPKPTDGAINYFDSYDETLPSEVDGDDSDMNAPDEDAELKEMVSTLPKRTSVNVPVKIDGADLDWLLPVE